MHTACLAKLQTVTAALLGISRLLRLICTCQSCSISSIAAGWLQTQIQERLHARRKAKPAEFVCTLELLEKRYRKAGFTPEKPVQDLRSGTFYLSGVDALYRRAYAFKG